MRSLSRISIVCAALAVAMGLSACGGSTHHGQVASTRPTSQTTATTTTPATPPVVEPPDPDPTAVVARVGGHVITMAGYEHQVAAELTSESPDVRLDPPHFTRCTARLEQGAARAPARTLRLSRAVAKSTCERGYREVRGGALENLIFDEWVIGGARELGVEVGPHPEYSLAGRRELDAEAIRGALRRSVGRMTPARVAAFYKAHRQAYVIPQTRDLEIARLGSEAEALKVKREIASGRSFASVVRGLRITQPIFSHGGLVLGLAPKVYAEKPLNDAIFSAQPNVLSGPVRIVLGYYVFDVKHIHPARQKSLAEVQASIRAILPGQLYDQAFAKFVSAWTQKWTARTQCAPGHVVAKCAGYDGPPPAAGENFSLGPA